MYYLCIFLECPSFVHIFDINNITAALVAINAIPINAIARDLIQYDDEPNTDDGDDDDPVVDNIPRTIFLPGLLFDVNTLSLKRCVQQFRFRPRHLCQFLLLPGFVKTEKGDSSPAIKALCLTLFLLSSPSTLIRIQLVFQRDTSALSRIIQATICFLPARWVDVLHWNVNSLTNTKQEEYSRAVGANAAHHYVFAFIDGFVQKICRPSFGQKSMCNGNKCFHDLKY